MYMYVYVPGTCRSIRSTHVAQCSQLLFVAAVVRYVYVRLCHVANAKSSQMRPTHGATTRATTTDHVLPVIRVENTYM